MPGGRGAILPSSHRSMKHRTWDVFIFCVIFIFVMYFLCHLVAVVVVALGLAGTALTHGDGGELPGGAEDGGACHVVTAAVPGAEGGVRAAGAGAYRGQVTIGAEAGLTLCVQTRRLQ